LFYESDSEGAISEVDLKPYYQDEWVTIYHGDCREILPTLEKVDLVLTDPPYGMGKAEWDRSMPRDWFMECVKLLYVTGAIYLFGEPLELSRFQVYFENKHSIEWNNRITWTYNGMRHPTAWSMKHEDCLIYTNKEHKFTIPKVLSNWQDKRWGDYRCLTDVLNIPRIQGTFDERENHPTQKPEALISILLNASSKSGNLILDPFLGSGTTAYCAKKLNRKSIGIEIEEKYCEIAAKRCSQSVMELV